MGFWFEIVVIVLLLAMSINLKNLFIDEKRRRYKTLKASYMLVFV